MNMLFVEDEALVSLEVQGLVESSGHACMGPVATGTEASPLIERHRPPPLSRTSPSRGVTWCDQQLGSSRLSACPSPWPARELSTASIRGSATGLCRRSR